MKSIKNHFGFIVPVFLICFCFELVVLIVHITKDYERRLYNDYNILVVSTKPLDAGSFASIDGFASLQELDTAPIIDKLKGDISDKNLRSLKSILPKFYAIKFSRLLDSRLASFVQAEILKIDGVSKVQTYSKTSDKIYKLLTFIKLFSLVFLSTIALLSFVVFIKQVSIWIVEHKEKFEIMDIYGASASFKSMLLYKKVIGDCVVSYIALLALFYNLGNIRVVVDYLGFVGVSLPKLSYITHISIICSSVLCVSILGVNYVMYKARRSA